MSFTSIVVVLKSFIFRATVFFRKLSIDLKIKRNKSIGNSMNDEILIATRIPKQRLIRSKIFFVIFWRQKKNKRIVKKVSHISNVPKWANWIKPTLVVVRKAARSPVVLSLTFFPRINNNGISIVAKRAEKIRLIIIAFSNETVVMGDVCVTRFFITPKK